METWRGTKVVIYLACILLFCFLLIFITWKLVWPNVFGLSSPSSEANEAIPANYVPEVLDVKWIPKYPTPSEDIHVYARIFDKFADIKNATLLYMVNRGQIQTVPMNLINGIPSNGTYSGTIPRHCIDSDKLIVEISHRKTKYD